MARISDIIESFIKDLIKEADGAVEFQRNEMANYFNCVPSQINYVISTRFTAERGYIIESRRGGGGYIKISRIDFNNDKYNYFMHIVNSIGESISQQSAQAFINNFYDYDIINEREHKLMSVVLMDKTLNVPPLLKDKLRASILKNMLLCLI